MYVCVHTACVESLSRELKQFVTYPYMSSIILSPRRVAGVGCECVLVCVCTPIQDFAANHAHLMSHTASAHGVERIFVVLWPRRAERETACEVCASVWVCGCL